MSWPRTISAYRMWLSSPHGRHPMPQPWPMEARIMDLLHYQTTQRDPMGLQHFATRWGVDRTAALHTINRFDAAVTATPRRRHDP